MDWLWLGARSVGKGRVGSGRPKVFCFSSCLCSPTAKPTHHTGNEFHRNHKKQKFFFFRLCFSIQGKGSTVVLIRRAHTCTEMMSQETFSYNLFLSLYSLLACLAKSTLCTDVCCYPSKFIWNAIHASLFFLPSHAFIPIKLTVGCLCKRKKGQINNLAISVSITYSWNLNTSRGIGFLIGFVCLSQFCYFVWHLFVFLSNVVAWQACVESYWFVGSKAVPPHTLRHWCLV